MKINTTRSKAKKAMRVTGNTKNRPEQILAGHLIKNHLPLWCKVDLEFFVSLYDPDNPHNPYERHIDIAVQNQTQKFAVELNGPPHDELPQIRRDNRYKTILEWEGNDWTYIEFSHISMPNLFTKEFVLGQRSLTIEETLEAYEEIKLVIGKKLPLGDANRPLIETILRKLNHSDQAS